MMFVFTRHVRWSRRSAPLLFAATAAAFVLSARPGATSADADEELRESAVCLDCHDEHAEDLMATPHRVSPDDDGHADVRVACSDCHPGDARHYEEDPEEYPRATPAGLTPLGTAELCSQCHTNSHQQSMMEGNVHSMNGVGCTSCHRVHGNTTAGLLQAEQTELCLGCHTATRGDFARPHRHPVSDGVVACSECHTTLDVTSRELAMNGTDAACLECHGEFRGPFPFEHQAAVGYSTEDGGCLTCHDAHGSYVARLLKQPYEPPHYQLCTQCHSVPRHLNNSRHGTEFAGVACNDCHTDVHGSYVSRSLLRESLMAEGCFNAGCHRF